MFLKLSENLEKTKALKRKYKGVVVDNDDPKKLQRVKVSIEGFMEATKDKLPWVSKKNSSFLGGSKDSGIHAVPEVGSYLEITFPFDDVYSPMYEGYWQDSNAKVSDFSDDPDYPDVYGLKDSTGNLLKINKSKNTVDFEHSSGVKLSLDKDGNMSMNIPEELKHTVKDYLLEASGDVTKNTGGDYTSTSQGNYTSEAAAGEHKSVGSSKGILEAPIVELGESASFHATLSENVIAYNDIHTHPAPQAPAGTLPTLPPTVPMSAKAGTALDVKALKIFLAGNT